MMNGEDISAARKERGKLATAQQRRAANPLKSALKLKTFSLLFNVTSSLKLKNLKNSSKQESS